MYLAEWLIEHDPEELRVVAEVIEECLHPTTSAVQTMVVAVNA
jgi:hypothetical protein